jgi:arylsulfatase A-like enzyme
LVVEWIETAPSPFFLWVHLFDPHEPYRAPPPYDLAYAREPELFGFLRRLAFPPTSHGQAADIANAYDGEILYMDAQLARILRRLGQRGLYDEALIVFAADHGEGLLQHGYLRHGITWNEQLHVPLIIKFPKSHNGRRGRSGALVSLIDILPTVVAEARMPLPTDQFDGVDVLRQTRDAALSQREVRKEGAWSKRLYTLTTLDWKYFHAEEGDQLFHLAADPHETRNVIEAHADVAQRMKSEILRLVAHNQDRSPLRLKQDLPDSVREQMRQLGYSD